MSGQQTHFISALPYFDSINHCFLLKRGTEASHCELQRFLNSNLHRYLIHPRALPGVVDIESDHLILKNRDRLLGYCDDMQKHPD